MTTDSRGHAVHLPQPIRNGFGKKRKFPKGAVPQNVQVGGKQRRTSEKESTKPNRHAISGVPAGVGSARGVSDAFKVSDKGGLSVKGGAKLDQCGGVKVDQLNM